MSVLWWVAIGFFAYWMVLLTISRAGLLPSNINTQGPIITVHTTKGRAFLDRLSAPERFWRAWGNMGLGIALVIMLGMFLVVVNAAIASMLAPEPTQVTEPRNIVVIPGVNEFLPLSAAPEIVAGLLIGLVVHEGGHGLLCRVENIDIESMGVALLAIIPIGAFVQPEETSQRRADRGGKSRMFAAGVMNNFAVTVLAFLLLFAIVGAAIAPAPGAAIGGAIAGSAVEDAGIDRGDRIVAVDGEPVGNASDLEHVLQTNENPEVTVELAEHDEVTVERSLLVVAAVPDGPAGLDTGDRIHSIDGERAHTEAGLLAHLEDNKVVTAETEAGETHTFPAGAYVPHVSEDGPFAEAGAPTGSVDMVLTGLDGERVVTTEDAQAILAETDPGETLEVEAYDVTDDTQPDGPETYTVELGEHDEGHGFMGIALQPGVTGVTVNDFGAQMFPTDRFFATLGGDTDEPSLFGLDTFFGKVFSAMILPIASLLGSGIEQNFAGFTGAVANFYEVQGPLGAAPGLVFITANVLFWTGWINFNLAIFNCIPAFPLDGGHLLRSSTESVISRLPIDNRYIAVKYVTVSVGLAMLAGLLLMVFGQGLLR